MVSVQQPSATLWKEALTLLLHCHLCFFRFTPGGSFPPSLTIKEEPSPIVDPVSHSSQSSEKESEAVQERPDVTYLSHHPRPAAVCSHLYSLA